MNKMIINEARLRNAINSGMLRTAASEALAEFDQLKNVLNKQPRNEVDINVALQACLNKLNGLIGAFSDISNPEPLPPVTEVPANIPLKTEANE